jgi:signal peptide peptidase SppA, 67K type
MKDFFKIILGTFIGCVVAITIGIFMLFGIIGSLAAFSTPPLPVVPSSAVLILNSERSIVEQDGESMNLITSLSGASVTKGIAILDVIQSIERAAEDPAIKFLYLGLSTFDAGISHLEEIRAAVMKFRESGKPVVAYADNYSQATYYLASAADRVYLSPSGSIEMAGISVSTLFFKDLLDKAGVEMQLIRHGKFKAAAEQLVSNKMSDENREQLQAYIDAIWQTWLDEIAASRGISAKKLNLMADGLEISTAKKALEQGLADKLVYSDELMKDLAVLFGVEDEKYIKNITIYNYAKATKKTNFKEKNKIAVVYGDGDIIMGKTDSEISSAYYADIFSQIRQDSTIKAVVFRVNSPGGVAQSADIIDRELSLLKQDKPLIVSMGDYAASGGYWISARADKIFVNNTSLTGSIGVFSMVPNIQKTLNKHLSINTYSVNTNEHSDLYSGYRPLNNKEIAYLQGFVEVIYTDFLNLVSQGRGLSYEEVDEIAQGRVWAGADALKIGLADEKGGIAQALEYAAASSNLSSYRLVEYPTRKTQIERLMEMLDIATVYSEGVTDIPSAFKKIYSEFKKETKVQNMARLPFNIYLNN